MQDANLLVGIALTLAKRDRTHEAADVEVADGFELLQDAGLGLTRSQWWVLTCLIREDGVIQSDLADQLDLGKPSLGMLLDKLEQRGWIRREVDGQDRRARRLWTTAKVTSMLASLSARGTAMNRAALEGLTTDGRNQLLDTLLHVKANLVAPKVARNTAVAPKSHADNRG